MSVNLYSFVEHSFTDKAYFNYDKFKDIVYKAQRLMDDVVDLEEEKINLILNKIENDPEPEEIKVVEKNLWLKIKDKLLKGRRTGLSCIGLADNAAALNLQYGSEEMIKVSEKIYKQFAISAYKSSIDMADERGAFPIWNECETKNPFIRRIFQEIHDPKHKDHVRIFEKRRNIACLTVPPSGTISMFGNRNGISSGIEPVPYLFSKRRRKVEEGNVVFIDQNGDKWEEYTIIHPKFLEWYTLNYNENLNEKSDEELSEIIKKSPYYESTAIEIDPLKRVKLQGTIQQWIDHSISSTINLKEDVSESDVSNIYFHAWKSGCKGITVYREGSRSGVILNAKKEEFIQHKAPKRPKSLPAEVYTVSVKGISWLIAVGIYENKPYEVFAFLKQWNLPKQLSGELVKVSKGRYDLVFEEFTLEDIGRFVTASENALTRMISTALRHGTDIQFVVEQLGKSEGDITSFSKAIARSLKKYIPDGTVKHTTCHECGSTNLIYQSGCLICNQCGSSKCE